MYRIDLLLLVGCLGVAISGCTTTESGGVTYDPQAQTTIVTGKETTIAPLMGPVRTLFLKAEISPSKTGLYFVVLYLSVDGWLAVDEVLDSAGNKLQGLRGSNETFDVRFGQVTKEIYYIPLTRRYLEAHRHSGIDIRLKGSQESVAANQPASFVDGFLGTLDATKRRLEGEVIVKKLIRTRSGSNAKKHYPARP